MTFAKIKPKQSEAARRLYVEKVIPAHKNHQGLRFVHLLECLDNNEAITVTAWDTKQDALAYEKSGDHEKMLAWFRDMFEGEPVSKAYEVTASSEPLLLRIF
jgi:heme-degrading monooxygenase HmoA